MSCCGYVPWMASVPTCDDHVIQLLTIQLSILIHESQQIPQTYHRVWTYWPLHRPPVQLEESRSGPIQWSPPLPGAGFSHRRRLWCLQSGLHVDHEDQVDQKPFTENNSMSIVNRVIIQLHLYPANTSVESMLGWCSNINPALVQRLVFAGIVFCFHGYKY